jgi:hypothetical protein
LPTAAFAQDDCQSFGFPLVQKSTEEQTSSFYQFSKDLDENEVSGVQEVKSPSKDQKPSKNKFPSKNEATKQRRADGKG